MPDQTPTPLDAALVEVIEFARAHGVDTAFGLAPADFGHQRTGPGALHVTYVDGDHVVSAQIDHYGNVRRAIGTVEWIHDECDEDREPCVEWCGECHVCHENPCECPADAFRDERRWICRRSDGVPIAGPDATRAYIECCLSVWDDETGPTADDMRARYRAALALLDQEAADHA